MARKSKQKIRKALALRLFTYDDVTGELRWIAGRGAAKAGDRVGCVHADGFRRLEVDGQVMRESAVIYLLHHGIWPTKGIFHVNHDKLDSRISNLANGGEEAGIMRNAARDRPWEAMFETEKAPPLPEAPLAWLLCA